MNVYTAIKEFSFPQIGIRIEVSDTIGKIVSKNCLLIAGTEYQDQAAYNWVGSEDSLKYMLSVGELPDPVTPGTTTAEGGSSPIGSGDSVVTVSGTAWGFVPSGLAVVVSKPDGGSNLFATVRESSITADGFVADLSAPASEAGYSLLFVVVE